MPPSSILNILSTDTEPDPIMTSEILKSGNGKAIVTLLTTTTRELRYTVEDLNQAGEEHPNTYDSSGNIDVGRGRQHRGFTKELSDFEPYRQNTDFHRDHCEANRGSEVSTKGIALHSGPLRRSVI